MKLFLKQTRKGRSRVVKEQRQIRLSAETERTESNETTLIKQTEEETSTQVIPRLKPSEKAQARFFRSTGVVIFSLKVRIGLRVLQNV